MSSPFPGLDELPEVTWEGDPINYVRRALTGFIQGVYAEVETEYRWSADANASRVFISAETPVDATAFGQRPCIAIARSELQYPGAGIGSVDEVDMMTGAITKSDFINGMFFIHHISSKQAEADKLAAFTADMVWIHWDLLNLVHVQTLGTLNIGQPGPVGSLVTGDSKGLVNVPLVVPFRLTRTVRREPLGAPILRAVTLHIISAAPAAQRFLERARNPRPDNNDPGNIRLRGPRALRQTSQAPESMRTSVKVEEE